jgi:hypothetical protein
MSHSKEHATLIGVGDQKGRNGKVRRGSVRVPRGLAGCAAGVHLTSARLLFERPGSAGCGVAQLIAARLIRSGVIQQGAA